MVHVAIVAVRPDPDRACLHIRQVPGQHQRTQRATGSFQIDVLASLGVSLVAVLGVCQGSRCEVALGTEKIILVGSFSAFAVGSTKARAALQV